MKMKPCPGKSDLVSDAGEDYRGAGTHVPSTGRGAGVGEGGVSAGFPGAGGLWASWAGT